MASSAENSNALIQWSYAPSLQQFCCGGASLVAEKLPNCIKLQVHKLTIVLNVNGKISST